MTVILRMPEVAANTTEAVLLSWNVEPGSPYTAGDVIATVETDKAMVDVEAEADGVILRRLVAEGTRVEVGTPIAVWGTTSESGGGADDPPAVPAGPPDPVADRPRLLASPLARRLARDLGVDLAAVVGTGPGGRIRRNDVEAMAQVVAPAAVVTREPSQTLASVAVENPAAEARSHDVPNTRMRQAIARRLTESKQSVPHFYLRGSARVDKLVALRAEVNEVTAMRVSLNDLVVKAVAGAHARVPDMNVQWRGDSIRRFSVVDVAIAVATENGLVTPVVRDVQSASLRSLVATTQDLVVRARERRLQQHELEGGSITVTNLGMYGTEEFAAIINPPQAAILAVGVARQEPVVRDGDIGVATLLRVTLAVDHRSVDGATAAQWMTAFLGLLEHPLQLLV